MNFYNSSMVADAICFEASRAANSIVDAVIVASTPGMLLRPKLSIDGDHWCALYGVDLQEGVAGFGKSPADAYADFDKAWYRSLP